jgi:hypothetical protein
MERTFEQIIADEKARLQTWFDGEAPEADEARLAFIKEHLAGAHAALDAQLKAHKDNEARKYARKAKV